MGSWLLLLLFGPLLAADCVAQESDPKPAAVTEEVTPADEPGSDTSGRTELNLLGQTDTASGESRRNENVQFNPIDNNALRELNKRIGTTATVVEEFRADLGYFGAEFGTSPSRPLHVPASPTAGVHGSLRYSHNNSIFSARSFFQVGDVRPARENGYGFAIGAPVWRGGYFSVEAGQQKIRGNVNGNVLVPTAGERTPLTADPDLRAVVERYLAAYPGELPNRTDINPRALNANSLQMIDDDNLTARLDQDFGGRDRLTFRYRFTSQHVDAFQLVAGQNPDTTTRVHGARFTWNRQWTATTLTNFTAGFDRVGSLLVPGENAVGPLVLISHAIEMLGPSSTIPIDRAQNLFRYAGEIRQVRGSHVWYAGFDLARRQVNGSEASSHRGTLSFNNDFGRDAITNFRWGSPSRMSGGVGNVHRGFRNWDMRYFAGDNWRVNATLTLNFGLRYEPVTQPWEVNGLSTIPYGCDCNNLAPRFGFVYRLPGGWGLLRGAYGLHYGEIASITFGQLRYNPPLNSKFEIRPPELDLRIPIDDLMRGAADPGGRNTFYDIAPDLVAPYSHQYNLSWEPFDLGRWSLRLGYVGSRSHKLIAMWSTNRARIVDGIETTSGTINDRRPNPDYYEIRRTLNGSRGYFDAGKVTVGIRRWRGLALDASYWFSKAIDLGAGYTSTATGIDARRTQSQWEFLVHEDLRGLSRFDQPHSFLMRTTYELPAVFDSWGWAGRLLKEWSVSAVVLAKTGTPFGISAGSDAPGYGNVDGSRADRPHVVDPSVLGRTIGDPDTSRRLLPASAFAFTQPEELWGSLGRNTFRKGGIANVNAMLARTFNVGGDRQLTLRAESINLLNTAQFAEPGLYLVNEDFGHITNTLNDGRAFRFLVQLEF